MIRYPDVKVKVDVVCKNGTALLIIGKVRDALKKHKVSQADRDEFFLSAISSDYAHALQVCREWVDFESPEDS